MTVPLARQLNPPISANAVRFTVDVLNPVNRQPLISGIPVGTVLVVLTSYDNNGTALDVGQSTVPVSSGGTTTLTITRNPIIAPGIPTQLSFAAQPANTVEGATMGDVIVSVLDANGTLVTNSTANITLALNHPGVPSAQWSGTLTQAAANGQATFTGLSVNLAGTGYSLTASAPSFNASVQSNTFTVASRPRHLVFSTQPAPTLVNQILTPAVQVQIQDSNGALVTTANNAITVAIGNNVGGASLGGALTVTATQGVATFSNLTLNQPGSGYTLTATGTGLVGAVSSPFSVALNVGPPDHLRFLVEPLGGLVNTTITPAVEVAVTELQGFTVPSAGNVITLNLFNSGANLNGTLSRPCINGVARFTDLTLSPAGFGYQLQASANGLFGGISRPFNLTNTPPTQWNLRNPNSPPCNSLAFGNGRYIVTINSNSPAGTGLLLSSTDGANWSVVHSLAASPLALASDGTTFKAVGFHNSGSQANDPLPLIYSSTDGLHWTPERVTGMRLSDVIAGPQGFVAVGQDLSSTALGVILTGF